MINLGLAKLDVVGARGGAFLMRWGVSVVGLIRVVIIVSSARKRMCILGAISLFCTIITFLGGNSSSRCRTSVFV